nr:hypothetical protein [Methylomarinum sp. Ch1-1]MDP4523241.1 hypothetical protein [Methylomarinum sp. Ch1-1]
MEPGFYGEDYRYRYSEFTQMLSIEKVNRQSVERLSLQGFIDKYARDRIIAKPPVEPIINPDSIGTYVTFGQRNLLIGFNGYRDEEVMARYFLDAISAMPESNEKDLMARFVCANSEKVVLLPPDKYSPDPDVMVCHYDTDLNCLHFIDPVEESPSEGREYVGTLGSFISLNSGVKTTVYKNKTATQDQAFDRLKQDLNNALNDHPKFGVGNASFAMGELWHQVNRMTIYMRGIPSPELTALMQEARTSVLSHAETFAKAYKWDQQSNISLEEATNKWIATFYHSVDRTLEGMAKNKGLTLQIKGQSIHLMNGDQLETETVFSTKQLADLADYLSQYDDLPSIRIRNTDIDSSECIFDLNYSYNNLRMDYRIDGEHIEILDNKKNEEVLECIHQQSMNKGLYKKEILIRHLNDILNQTALYSPELFYQDSPAMG